MAGFTSEEKQAVIDKFLLGIVTVPRTSLGARDVVTARDDVYSLLTTTILLRPDSYFYVILLAKNRLEALRRQQADALDFILDPVNVAALNRRGTPVTSTAELTNARAALLNMNAGLNQAGGVSTRNLGPEVSRFRASIERFVRRQLAPNVVEASAVTETAGELRERIRSLWVEVTQRHEEMLVLMDAITNAVTNLSSARLPEAAVQGVVGRMEQRIDELTTQLANDRTLETHREAMLELLTMRTLLARVSSFRTPQEVLAPLTGDSSQLTPVTGTTPASITGSLSGPFNVPPTSTIDFETATPMVASSIPMPRYSNAEIISSALTYPLTFGTPASLRLRVNGTLHPAQSFAAAAYATDILFLAAINLYLTGNAIPATAFISGSQIVIRSTSSADVSSVSIQHGTAAEVGFLTTTGFTRDGICKPITAAEIIAAGIPYPSVRLSEEMTEYGNFNGRTAALSVLDLSKVSGTVDVAGGTSLTFTTNLESAGVRRGDFLFLTGPHVRELLTVVGGTVTFEETVPALGLAIDYRIGPDLRDVPVGARVLIGSNAVPLNAGPYRVTAGDVAQLTLDRTFFANADPVAVMVQTSFLVATATGASPSDGITANPASTGATAVGFTVTPTQQKSGLTRFDAAGTVDFLARGVSVGDQLTLLTSPTSTVADITAVELDSLETDPVAHFTGNIDYVIRSARYLAWQGLVDDLEAFDPDFEAADFAITRILNGAAATALLSGGGPVGLYATDVDTLESIMDYSVPFERSIDNILRTLVEQGMDRAADLFTSLRVVEFFSMHPDGVSYASNLIRTTIDVTRDVAPVSRFAKSIMGSPEVRLRFRRRNTSG